MKINIRSITTIISEITFHMSHRNFEEMSLVLHIIPGTFLAKNIWVAKCLLLLSTLV